MNSAFLETEDDYRVVTKHYMYVIEFFEGFGGGYWRISQFGFQYHYSFRHTEKNAQL